MRSVSVAADHALLSLFQRLGERPEHGLLEYQARLLAQTADVHERRGWTSDPRAYLQEPPPLDDPRIRPGRHRGVDVLWLSWPSGHRPDPEEPGAAAWFSRRRNRIARAWLVETRVDAPWLVCLHGHGGGFPAMDLTAFHARHLTTQVGVNLAFVVLPRHGRRREHPLDRGGFLTGDVIEAVHGTSQSIWDVRRLLSWLRRVRDADRIGVYGMSLGGWTTAILAGVEDGLHLAMAGIPLVDVPDLFRRHAPEEQRRAAVASGALGPLADVVASVVSPLSVDPLVRPESRFVHAGRHDQLTGPSQAERLLAHWDDPEHLWYDGGHVGFVWNRDVRDFVDNAIRTTLLT